jgi:hypothetical protein
MIGNNMKLALLFTILFSNFFIVCMNEDVEQARNNQNAIDFNVLNEKAQQELNELLENHKNEVAKYEEKMRGLAIQFFDEICRAIINDDINQLNKLFDSLKKIERPSLFLNMVMNMTYEDLTPLLLAVNYENLAIISYLINVSKKYCFFIDDKEMLDSAQSKAFKDKEAQKKICRLVQPNSLLKKYHEIKASFDKEFLAVPNETQSDLK